MDEPDPTPEQEAFQKVFSEGLVARNTREGGVPYLWSIQGIKRFEQLLGADSRVPAIATTNAPPACAENYSVRVGDVARYQGSDGIYRLVLALGDGGRDAEGITLLRVRDRYGRESSVQAALLRRVDPPIPRGGLCGSSGSAAGHPRCAPFGARPALAGMNHRQP